MAYIFGAAIKGIWSFVYPQDNSRQHPPSPAHSTTPSDPSDPSDPTSPDIPQAYINHTMQSAFSASKQSPHLGGPAANIPWAQIHYAHISNLRGQLRYLKFVGEKNNCTNKISAYIQRTRQALHDAKAAATIAGIIPLPTTSTLSKRRRRSVTFAHSVETLPQKKPKIRPAPEDTVPRHSKRTTRGPPPADKVAALTPALGKRVRNSEEEEAGEKAYKRGRLVYMEKKYWKPGPYVGDSTDEYDSDDDADFAPMPNDMGSTTSTQSSASAPPPQPSAQSTGSDNTPPPSHTKPTKHKPDDTPQTSAKKHKKSNVQVVIGDSSKRHVEEEMGAQVVPGGDVKKQKRA